MIRTACFSLLELPFLAAYVVLSVLDIGLTLSGQSAAYWSGQYELAREFNLLIRWSLVVSPWLFLALTALLSSALVAVALQFGRRLATVVVFLGCVGHFIGAGSWLLHIEGWGLPLVLLQSAGVWWLIEKDWPRFAGGEACSS